VSLKDPNVVNGKCRKRVAVVIAKSCGIDNFRVAGRLLVVGT
jgi:hypothetical protein